MRTRGPSRSKAARADYLGGEPAGGRAISGGRLNVDTSGLRFSGPDGAELRLPLDALLGISISGRAAERERRAIHGTMRVAGMRDAVPTEWLFAVDRSAAASIRRQIDRELASRGSPPLPFVEELDGFPLNGHRPELSPDPEPEFEREPEIIVRRSPSLQISMAELGHRLNTLDAQRQSRQRRRILPWVLLGSVLIAAEVLVPLILLRGG